MNRNRASFWWYVAPILSVAIGDSTGCHLVFPYHGPTDTFCPRYVYDAPIYKCKTTMDKLEILFTSHGSCVAKPDVKHVDPSLGLKVQSLPYCSGEPWLIQGIEPEVIRGALWIQTSWNMKNSYDPDGGLSLTLQEAAEGVYLAYDSRVNPPPTWLMEPNWVAQKNRAGGTAYIRVERPDGVNNLPYTNLTVYRSNQSAAKNALFPLPGNLHQGPQQPTLPANPAVQGSKPDDICMYMVIVNPIKRHDCEYVLLNAPVETYTYDNSCARCMVKYVENGEEKWRCETEEEVRAAATKALQEELNKDPKYPPGTHVVGDLVLKPNTGSCPGPSPIGTDCAGSKLIKQAIYRHNSKIEFNAADCSIVLDVHLDDGTKSYTAKIGGTLDFQYTSDAFARILSIRVNGMFLRADPIETDVGTFTDTVVALAIPVDANCTDPNTSSVTPCDTHQIEPNEFIAVVSTNDGKGTIVVQAENQHPVQLHIDHASRTFRFVGGPLRATLRVNDQDRELSVSVDLTGHFVNFAPKAMPTKEYKTWSECGGTDRATDPCDTSRNKDDIVLWAGESFDIYDQCPNNPANYEWYEDYALVTEKLWGTGIKVTIPKGHLGFGVHKMTLMLKDNYGAVDMLKFDVEVRDTQPPVFTKFPIDRLVFRRQWKEGGVQVDIGDALAEDICCGHVLVTNDAPPYLGFGLGATPVTWRADDGRGNVASKVQNVIVFGLEEPLLRSIKQGLVHLRDVIAGASSAIEATISEPNCPVDLQSLIQATNELLVIVRGSSVSGQEQEDQRQEIIRKLEGLIVAEGEADAFVRTQSDVNEQRRGAREAARDRLNSASDVVNGIVGMPDPNAPVSIPPPMGPCFIATAAYGSAFEPEVVVLRNFRDTYLLTHAPGRWLVGQYYRHSPHVAAVIARHECLRGLVRGSLRPVVWSIRHPVCAVVLALIIGVCFRQRRVLTGVLLRGLRVVARS